MTGEVDCQRTPGTGVHAGHRVCRNSITSVVIPDTLGPKAADQAARVIVQGGKQLPSVLATTEESERCRRWRCSTQSWVVPFNTEHHGIGHRHKSQVKGHDVTG